MSRRRALIAAAALHAGIALVIATIVVPAVLSDTFPAAASQRAANALWVMVAANLVVALCYLAIGVWKQARAIASRVVSIVGLVLSLLFTVPLLDAGFAFWSHGPAMHVASIALFGCAIGCVLVAILFVASYRVRTGGVGGG